MKHYRALFGIALLVFPQAVHSQVVSDLQWLTGLWKGTETEAVVEELWMDMNGSMTLGVHREIREGRPVFFEYLRIEAREDGVYYVSKPSNQPEAAFKLTFLSATRAVFENPEHDFPNRIVYELDNEKTLRITISGIDDGVTTQSFWLMEKAQLSSGE